MHTNISVLKDISDYKILAICHFTYLKKKKNSHYSTDIMQNVTRHVTMHYVSVTIYLFSDCIVFSNVHLFYGPVYP